MGNQGQKREYGTGSVIRRGNQVGIAVSLGKHPDGTRNRPVFYAPTLPEARAKAEAARVAHRAGELALAQKAFTVQQLFEDVLPVIKQTRREKTYIEYEGFYRLHIRPYIAAVPLRNLTAAHVQGIITAMGQKGLSDSTIHACRKILSSALEYARRWKWVSENVARDAETPRRESKPLPEYSVEQVRALLRAIEGISAQHLLTLCVATGVRPSEGAAVRESDLTYQDGIPVAVRLSAQLQHSKGTPGSRLYSLAPLKTRRSYRTIPLSKLAQQSIIASQARNHTLDAENPSEAAIWAKETGLVFRTIVGTPYTPEGIRKQFYAAQEKAGLERVTRHQLRHVCASLLIDAGESPATVAAILGDDPRTVMARYVHAFAHAQEAAMQNLGEILQPVGDRIGDTGKKDPKNGADL